MITIHYNEYTLEFNTVKEAREFVQEKVLSQKTVPLKQKRKSTACNRWTAEELHIVSTLLRSHVKLNTDPKAIARNNFLRERHSKDAINQMIYKFLFNKPVGVSLEVKNVIESFAHPTTE